MIRTLVLVALICGAQLTVLAQRDCVSSQYFNDLNADDPLFATRHAAISRYLNQKDNQIQMFGAGDDLPAQTTIIIPVVVHVVYNRDIQNIADAQIHSQIAILNADFRRLNADTVNTPARFKPFAADCNIEFRLATVDPDGRPTSGIVRKQTGTTGFSMNDNIKFDAAGGHDAWDADKYLNIWVGPMSGGIVGYASPPGSDKDRDGVVIRYNAFGSTGTAAAPFNKGRTAVHEIGHWLGLIHIWGDVSCGDDEIDDTPVQENFTAGCPRGEVMVSCNNDPDGNMYMNYMDLTDDACTNLFTHGQKTRMRSLFNPGGPRHALLSSNALDGPGLPPPSNPPPGDGIRLYPNPATSLITVDINGDQTLIGQYYTLINQYGQMIRYQVISADRFTVNIAALPAGVYFLRTGTAGKTMRILKTNK